MIEQAYIRLKKQGVPEARDAYIHLHDFIDRQRGGKHFDKFFTDVSKGDKTYVPHSEFVPILDMSKQKDWMRVREQYHGNFDKHIKTSIPTFGELQDKKGHAIVTAFGDQEIDMLDIGGSEGSFSRTISHMSNGKIKTEILDPNDAMEEFYHSRGVTPGSTYNKAAFIHGWINEDGSKIPELNSKTTEKRYDIIHEAMAFQFISNQREPQVKEVKSLLIKLPRRVTIGEHTMPSMISFKEWSKHHNHQDLIGDIFSNHEFGKMTICEIEEKYTKKIKRAAVKLGIHLTSKDVENIICKFIGLEDIKPHISHYHFHM